MNNDDEDKPKLTIYDFEKERSNREKLGTEEEIARSELKNLLLDLYAQTLSIFLFMDSERNYCIAKDRLKEAFTLALSDSTLDFIEEYIEESDLIIIEDPDLDEDVEVSPEEIKPDKIEDEE